MGLFRKVHFAAFVKSMQETQQTDRRSDGSSEVKSVHFGLHVKLLCGRKITLHTTLLTVKHGGGSIIL